MSHRPVCHVRFIPLAVAAALCALAGPSAQAVDLIARGSLAGTLHDLSGRGAALENGVAGDLLGGMGSGLAWAGGSTFLALPDRGPNAVAWNSAVADTSSYVPRVQTLTLALTATASGSLPYALTPTLSATTLLSTTDSLNYGSAPSLASGGISYFTGRSDAFGAGSNSLNPLNSRLDTEGIRVANDGRSVFISDEYGPYVYQFDRATGQRMRSFALPAELGVSVPGPTTASEGAPTNTVGRVANKGMEGLAITPDGRTLVGFMQSPLLQDGGDGGRYNRIVTIDIASGTTHQFAYDNQVGGKNFNSSELLALNSHEFLVLERDGKGLGDDSNAAFKQLRKVDIAGAADVTGLSGAAALAAKAVSGTLFLDIRAKLNAAGIADAQIPAKLEGAAFGEDVMVGGQLKHTLYIANDNDFLATSPLGLDNPNQWFVFAFDDSDLAGSVFQNQQLTAVPEPASWALMLAGLAAAASKVRRLRAVSSRMPAQLAAGALLVLAFGARAADQTVPGAGNSRAAEIAAASPRVQEAHEFLVRQARTIKNRALREATLDLLQNRNFCVTSRIGVDAATKAALLDALTAAGFLNPADDASFPGGLVTGVFPPLLDAASNCPHLPMGFDAAPGSSFASHHGYPGGLPIHEANNLRAGLGLVDGYRRNYRAVEADEEHGHDDEDPGWLRSPFFIDQDVIIAAPIWHDWAKTVVFQWFADGTEFKELNIGGTPANQSATGGHHIISIAESIKRALPPVFVIAQASAHSNPTLGNEFKVVAWIRAAGILAQVDPVAGGYLVKDAQGAFHLPPLRKLADGFDLAGSGRTNLLAEYTIHNLSDGDFTFSIPAADDASALIAKLAPGYGFNPTDANYNTHFRNPVFAGVSQERILILYGNGGLAAVRAELDALRARRRF